MGSCPLTACYVLLTMALAPFRLFRRVLWSSMCLRNRKFEVTRCRKLSSCPAPTILPNLAPCGMSATHPRPRVAPRRAGGLPGATRPPLGGRRRGSWGAPAGGAYSRSGSVDAIPWREHAGRRPLHPLRYIPRQVVEAGKIRTSTPCDDRWDVSIDCGKPFRGVLNHFCMEKASWKDLASFLRTGLPYQVDLAH